MPQEKPKEATQKMVKEIYAPRPEEVKKYDYGFVLVIGGSEFYTGAPALAAFAAFRAGADMVRIIAPQRAADIIASFSPVLATLGLEGSHLSRDHLATLLSRTQAAHEVAHGNVAVVIGGGLGRSEEVQETIREFLAQTDVPVVIDADAIHAVGGAHAEAIAGKPFVITPHRHEFMVLTGRDIREAAIADRIPVVQEEAQRLGVTILLKGQTDIVSDGKELWQNTTGSPYLSVGGTGDTLAGIIGALLARGVSPVQAAAVGAYINGKAGHAAAGRMKESLVATDVVDYIREVIQ